MFERYFANKKKNEEEDYINGLVRRIALIYTQLPNGPKKHKDGSCSAVIKRGFLDILSHTDNNYLLLNGEGERELTIQVDARGGQNWIGFAVGERRVKLLQNDTRLTLSYERRENGVWEKKFEQQEIEWSLIQQSVDFIEREVLPTVQ